MNPLIVVTGGTKGIGRAIVELFASNGFDIAICARNAIDLQQLKDKIESLHSATKVFVEECDVSQKTDVAHFATFVKSLNRPVDVLVNNAGVFAPGKIIDEPDGVLEQMIHTNLYSAYRLTRELVPMMIEAKKGHIFNLCSTASITAYANGGSYCVSKFALYGLTKVLREELKPHGIKVTALLPGATLTASWEGVELPPERFMKPEDVADTIWSAYKLSQSAVIEEIIMRPQLGDLG
jgi:short-subunit dehydrogenase